MSGRWLASEDIFASKEENFKIINQFRLVSLINIDKAVIPLDRIKAYDYIPFEKL